MDNGEGAARMLLLMVMLAPFVLGAKGFFYPKYRHEVYNKMIPEDTEVDVLLHKAQSHKLYFILESGYRPLSVTVTPCFSEALLEWKISHSIFQNPIDGRSGAWTNQVVRPPSPAATYVGHERRSYSSPRAPPGIYALELRSNDGGRVRVVVTTRPTTQMPFHPPLPPDPTVRIVKIKRNRILVSWKESPSPNNLHYCVSANNKANCNSMCAAESHGGIHCVGRKTWHLFKGLQRSRTYYLDVFVVDSETNASSAYVGVSATLRNGGSGAASLIPRLKDDSLATFTLDESNGYALSTKYPLPNTPGPLLVFLQSCTGPGPVNVHISRGGGLQKHDIMSTTVMDVKVLQLPRQVVARNSSSNFLSFSVRSTGRQGRRVRLWVSGRKRATPFPQLPSDKGVRVLDSLTTCDSVTIGWKSSPDERVRYCIYKQVARDPVRAPPQDFCEEEKVGSVRQPELCRRYHRFSRRRFSSLILQRVKGLRRGTAYLFEVQVTKVKGRMLPYEQVWATTLDTCSRHAR